MSLTEIILLAIALGVDCLVVSFCQGLVINRNKAKTSVALGSTMGFFQGIMPVLGYIITGAVSDYIQQYSKWIVFTIFAVLGLKFILESISKKEECNICRIDLKCLLLFGIATSIDAFGAGITLKLTASHITSSAIIIGLTSFIMAVTGFLCGNSFKKFPSKYLGIAGGLILLGLAINSIW